jgi:nucleotide-binding universal stress UspA family protein
VEAGVVDGRDWEHALDSLPWEDGEILVIGSSRLAPVARIFLGSNATKIIRSSPVPVLVIPRGADVRLEDTAPTSLGHPPSVLTS